MPRANLEGASMRGCTMDSRMGTLTNLEGKSLKKIWNHFRQQLVWDDHIWHALFLIPIEKQILQYLLYEEWIIIIFHYSYSGANLKGAMLDNSQMNGVNLRLASLKGASLRSCNLRYAIMAGTDLEVSEIIAYSTCCVWG